MRITAFAASNSLASINKALVTFVAHRYRDKFDGDAEVRILNLNDYEMPIYRSDREKAGGIPDAAQSFFNALGECDALIISFAEYNGSYTTAFKNIFDWSSRVGQNIYQSKPTIMMAASPGGRGGAGVLGAATMAAPHFGADLVGTLSVARFPEVFDTRNGVLTNESLIQELDDLLHALNAKFC